MMMELTFDALGGTSGGARVPVVTIRADEALLRHAQVRQLPPRMRPADAVAHPGDAIVPAPTWNAGNRLLRRIEDGFAVVVLAALLGLGALTFGYAVDALAAAAPASVSPVAASR